MFFLETHNVVKRYSNHLALDHVSIAVREGTVFGLLGPNGAGKTTLIRIINRITAPDEGTVLIRNHPFTPKDVARIGYLPEERGLYRKMKVGEHAIYLAQLKGIDKKTAKQRLAQWFEKLEIMSWWNKKVEELSKGMQQKVQFICTVIHDPDLLIFDEPFSGFDPVNAELLKREILTLKSLGKTIIFSTHNMQSVEEICDDIALINSSKVALSGQIDEVRRKFDEGKVSLEFRIETPMDSLESAKLQILESHFANGIQKITIVKEKNQKNREIPLLLPERAHLLSLHEEIPSMNDIFIATVKNKAKEMN